MNFDFLTNLLGGQGNQTLAMLLPMLLGGKMGGLGGAFPSNLSGVSDLIQNASLGTSKGEYPPLFGEKSGDKSNVSSSPDLFSLLGKIMPQSVQKQTTGATNGYPYELQYNRPEKDLHKLR